MKTKGKITDYFPSTHTHKRKNSAKTSHDFTEMISKVKNIRLYNSTKKRPSTSLKNLSMNAIIDNMIKSAQISKQISTVPPLLHQELQTNLKKQVKRITKRSKKQESIYTNFVDDIDIYYRDSKKIVIPYDILVLSTPRIMKKLYTHHGTPNSVFESFIQSNRKFQQIDKFLPEGHHLHTMGWYYAYLVKMDNHVFLSFYLNKDEHCFAFCIE